MVTVYTLIALLTQQKPLPEWSPTARPRELRSFADFPDLSPAEIEAALVSNDPEQQLRAVGSLYKTGDYKHIRDFFKVAPGRFGNSGKLLLVLAYLQLFAEQPDRLSRLVLPLLKELLAQEPSEFGGLCEWIEDYIHERPLPPRFYEQSNGCKGA